MIAGLAFLLGANKPIAFSQNQEDCQTCHMGFDHPQWEMYFASKHGVRYLLKQSKVLPENAAAPTCQTCQ